MRQAQCLGACFFYAIPLGNVGYSTLECIQPFGLTYNPQDVAVTEGQVGGGGQVVIVAALHGH